MIYFQFMWIIIILTSRSHFKSTMMNFISTIQNMNRFEFFFRISLYVDMYTRDKEFNIIHIKINGKCRYFCKKEEENLYRKVYDVQLNSEKSYRKRIWKRCHTRQYINISFYDQHKPLFI